MQESVLEQAATEEEEEARTKARTVKHLLSPRASSWLFDEGLFLAAVDAFHPRRSEIERARRRLRRLGERTTDQLLNRCGKPKVDSRGDSFRIGELNAREAFNRHLFIDTLGYSDVLGTKVPYTILPEFPHGSGRRTDLAIGRFTTRAADTTVTMVVELKRPGADLFAKQANRPHPHTREPMTAFDQAWLALQELPCAGWCAVSNMEELYLYHRQDPRRALRIDLLDGESAKELLFALGPGGIIPTTGVPARLETVRLRVARLS